MNDDAMPDIFNMITEANSKMRQQAELEHIAEKEKDDLRASMHQTVNTVEVLRGIAAAYLPTRHFMQGDIVTWVPGFQNRRISGPMVVVEVRARKDAIRLTSAEVQASSHLWQEPLDTCLAFKDPEDSMITTMWVDSGRLEIFYGTETRG